MPPSLSISDSIANLPTHKEPLMPYAIASLSPALVRVAYALGITRAQLVGMQRLQARARNDSQAIADVAGDAARMATLAQLERDASTLLQHDSQRYPSRSLYRMVLELDTIARQERARLASRQRFEAEYDDYLVGVQAAECAAERANEYALEGIR